VQRHAQAQTVAELRAAANDQVLAPFIAAGPT